MTPGFTVSSSILVLDTRNIFKKAPREKMASHRTDLKCSNNNEQNSARHISPPHRARGKEFEHTSNRWTPSIFSTRSPRTSSSASSHRHLPGRLFAMTRERRQRGAPNAAHYVGYADDDEDINSIMAKFKRLEELEKKTLAASNHDIEGDESPPKISEDELVRAVGASAPVARVDYSGNGAGVAGHERRVKGELVVTGDVELVEANVRPSELDVDDADDAFGRLAAGAGYAPPNQREPSNERNDAADPSAPPPVPIRKDKDVVLVELKGIDAYTRERIVEGLPTSAVGPDRKELFIGAVLQEMRMMAVNGEESSLAGAAKAVHDRLGAEGWMKRAASSLLKMCAKDPKEFRAKSKGVGLVCIRKDGIPAGEYLGPYCGELYPGWRWFEKEVAAQKVRRDVRAKDAVPTFYNAAVERERTDPRGYDMLFIDGMVKGSLLSRASHSCEPNAEMRIRVRSGSYAVEMVTNQDVAYGEEVCWDYQCQTDSRQERDNAICLCSSKGCRVSYLHFTGESDLASHLRERCTAAHVTASLLRACGPHASLGAQRSAGGSRGAKHRSVRGGEEGEGDAECTYDEIEDERAMCMALTAAGLKEGEDRSAPGTLRGLPAWVKRFAASCVAYIDEEREALAVTLAEAAAARTAAEREAATAEEGSRNTPPLPKPTSKEELAAEAAAAKAEGEAEAAGVAATRMQSLAVTLDKVRHVLSVQLGGTDSGRTDEDMRRLMHAPPPLLALLPAEAVALLNERIARVVEAAEAALVPAAAKLVRDAAGAGDKKQRAATLSDARACLRAVSAALWRVAYGGDCGPDSKAAAATAGDLCYLLAETKTFFKAQPGAGFTSPYVQIGSTGGGTGVVQQMEYGPLAVWAFLATWHDEYLEAAEDRLRKDTRGAVQLPAPFGPLEALTAKDASAGRAARACKQAPKRGASQTWHEHMCLSGGGEAWVECDGFSWCPVDAREVKTSAPRVLLGSPVFDSMLAGVQDPGKAVMAELLRARGEVLASGCRRRSSVTGTSGRLQAAREVEEDNALLVPAWNQRAVTEPGNSRISAFLKSATGQAPSNDSVMAAVQSPVAVPMDEVEGEHKRGTEIKVEEHAAAAMKGPKASPAAAAAFAAAHTSDGNGDSEKNEEMRMGVEDAIAPSMPSLCVNSCGEGQDDVACMVCGVMGHESPDFVLCVGCPGGGHLDCLNMHCVPEGNWFCAACRGGMLAGIKPVGRAGFAAAAAAAVAAAAASKGNSASCSISTVPGSIAAVPSIGPVSKHHLVNVSGTLTESSINKRNGTLGDKNTKVLSAAEALFPVPPGCPASIAVDCGGAKGEFVVLEGLVHCMCRGCEVAVPAGFQPTNVFGLQAFEFHGGRGSAGKWKASIKAFPEGFPKGEEVIDAENVAVAPAAEEKKGGKLGKRGREEVAANMKEAKKAKHVKKEMRNGGEVPSEPLGTWLERECPEHPCLARSRNKENAA